MMTRLVIPILAIVLAAGLHSPASGEPAKRTLHVDILLTDGSRILGVASDVSVGLAAAFGEIDLVLTDGDRIDSNGDQETVTYRSADGDVIKGVIIAPFGTRAHRSSTWDPVREGSLSPSFTIHPYGASENRRVVWDSIRSLRALDPIRIAGSEGATWEIEYENASGWTPVITGGVLTVTQVDSDTVHSAGGGRWGTVRLRRRVDHPGDFHLTADISWDDKGAGLRAMQNLFVSVAGKEGGLIAAVGHNDSWVGETGSRYSQLPGIARTHSSGYNSQPTSGRATVEILRKDGEITILWDGKTKQCATAAAKVSHVEVQFDFYDFQNRGRNSAFGSFTLHRLELR